MCYICFGVNTGGNAVHPYGYAPPSAPIVVGEPVASVGGSVDNGQTFLANDRRFRRQLADELGALEAWRRDYRPTWDAYLDAHKAAHLRYFSAIERDYRAYLDAHYTQMR